MEITSENANPQDAPSKKDLSNLDRWGSLIAGGSLVLAGLKERSLRGALMAVVGGGLAYRGVAGKSNIQDAIGLNKPVKVEKTVTINKSPEELYRFWRNFENLPYFMQHLKYVRVRDEKHSHWVANAPLGSRVEWDAEIIDDIENRLIVWASVADSDVDNSGFVRFQKAPGNLGTEVKVVVEYNPPGGAIGAAFAKLFGEEPEQQLADNLRHLKQFMEAGEIATTVGQTSCRRKV